jgi:hypothetical protein
LILSTINIVIMSTARFNSRSVSLLFIAAFVDHQHALIFELIVSFPLLGGYDHDVAKKLIMFKSNLQHSTSATAATNGLIGV